MSRRPGLQHRLIPRMLCAVGTRATAAGTSLLQRVLVVMQAALSLVLLVGAGLFAQNLIGCRVWI